MSLLTTAQLTFCDLKDSYSIHLDTECVGLACDNNGLVSKEQRVTINYRAFTGPTLIGVSCSVSNLPTGVTLVSNTSSSSSEDGSIILKVAQGATLNNEATSNAKLVFTTLDTDKFTFEKYITFVKSMTGYDGTDAVSFQIYSVDGFEFNDTTTSIELNTVAFKGGSTITDAEYQWYWWNNKSSEASEYEIISGATSSKLTVGINDLYALSSIKCVMTYNGITYEDYISLSKEAVIYTSIVKFFNGSNIFKADDLYIVAYIELYQNNNKIETIYADSYYTGISTVDSSNVITSNITGNFSNGDKTYFICKINNIYEAVLGQYTDGKWYKINAPMEYEYTNSLYPSLKSNVIAISKESINKSQNIDFAIFKDNACISNTYVNIIDSNDPIISSTAPENPVIGQLWLDTSASPHILRCYNDSGTWEDCSEKIGGVVFTSQPMSYRVGDLWILAEGEKCSNFGPGSMLKAIATATSATVIPEHWVDADAKSTELKQNISQYFKFDTTNGLTIGQDDDKFYVRIDSTEMGFYDNRENQHQKIVKISNHSATILNAKLKGNTEFYGQINICDPNAVSDDDVDDARFVWKIEESNGSLSLSIAK